MGSLFCFLETEYPTMQPRLCWNSCSSCLSLLSAGITDVQHYNMYNCKTFNSDCNKIFPFKVLLYKRIPVLALKSELLHKHTHTHTHIHQSDIPPLEVRGLNSGLMLARQALYNSKHAHSPFQFLVCF
jgi:hypothetical protein